MNVYAIDLYERIYALRFVVLIEMPSALILKVLYKFSVIIVIIPILLLLLLIIIICLLLPLLCFIIIIILLRHIR